MNSDIKKRIDAINNIEAIQFFFGLLKTFFQTASITETDERLAITVRNDDRKRFSVNLNGRLILTIKGGNEFGLMINNADFSTISHITYSKIESFEKQIPEASLLYFDFDVLKQNTEVLKPLWLKSCLEYLPAQSTSQYRRHHIAELFNIASNEIVLNQYLTETTVKYTKFKQIIQDFETYLKSEDSKLSDFSFDPIHKNWVWIIDPQKIIGTEGFCHYEIISRKTIPNKIWVEIHFETKYKNHFKTLFDNVESLNCFWNDDHKHPELSLAYEESFDYNDIDLFAKMEKALLYLETNFGDAIRNEFQNMDMKIKIKPEIKMDSPLNQILYGPPGTGKTYNSINKAISIINPGFNLTQERSFIKKEYDRLVAENQILFTTFHQSMSYEDFIEGIKPITVEKKVLYTIEDGIFKNIALEANKKSITNFNKAYDNLLEDLEKINKNKDYLELITKTGKSFWVKVNGNKNLNIYTTADKNFQGSMTKEKLKSFADGINTFLGWEGYANGVVKKMIDDYSLSIDLTDDNSKKNFVLIIDEINRGNVSQIFGELITLIEEDKRIGKKEALEVILPYSKEKFGVPPNLYIVGTMNTADRSVEALDTALRRRFSFEEMPPKSKVVEEKRFTDYPRVAIMEKINNRIELLLDRNHTLGHAYFMKNNFKSSFQNEIIPLLQEYFYNDYGKIGLVLGRGFVREKSITVTKDKSIFADFDTKNEVDILKSYELIPFNNIDFDTAIATLLT
jgi:flavodoxin